MNIINIERGNDDHVDNSVVLCIYFLLNLPLLVLSLAIVTTQKKTQYEKTNTNW